MIESFSLIVPSYRQEKTIVGNIRFLQKNLARQPYRIEIIVVLDGIVDNSLEKLKKAKIDSVKIVSYSKNHGKGYAVRKGVLAAKGDIIGFLDGGRDISFSSLLVALDLMRLHNADIVLGSKLHQDSVVKYPVIRRILTFGYRLITKILFNLDVKDTQVGLKLFRRKVARDVFSRIVVKAFAFDVEVLAVARLLGYNKIYETPVKLRFKEGSISNTNFWKVAFLMLWDTMAIFYRMYFLKFYKKRR